MSVDQVEHNQDQTSSLCLQVIDVLDFNHETDRKCKRPIHVEALVEVLKGLLKEGEQENVTAQSISKLHKNYCKKNTATNVKKNFKCKSCSCLIESVDALVAHVKGAKHVHSIKDYKPYREEKQQVNESKKREEIDICLTLEEHLKASKEPLIGLSHVQEYISTEVPTAYRMYKCMLFECDGAWGTSYDFPFHLFSPDHLKSFLGEVVKLNTTTISKLSPEDLISEASKHSNRDFGQLQRIEDEERWKIYSCGLATRSIGRVRRNQDKQESVGEIIRYTGAGSANASMAAAAAAAAASAMAGGKRKLDDVELIKLDVKKAKLETKALKAKRPGFTDERYNETSYFHDPETNLRKVYPYYFTFTTFTKGRWVGERILDVFAREFRAHPAEEYERCIKAGTLTVNYEKVDVDYRLKHNDLLANVVHRHEVPVSSDKIQLIHMDDDLVVVNKPASIPVHPCGRYRHNTVVFILAKEYGLKNLRTIHRLDRLTSGLLLFGRNPKKAREMEQQIRTRQVQKQYVCRVEGEFPEHPVCCKEPIEVVSYKIGVCKVSSNGKDCHTEFQRLSFNGRTSVVLCRPRTGRMHQIRVHLQYLGYPVVNDPLYNHSVFGPEKGRGGNIGKTDEQLIHDLIAIHNAENWLGLDEDGGGVGGSCDVMMMPRLPELSPPVKTSSISGQRKACRSDTPDSAVDVQSAVDSPNSTTSDFNVDVATSVHSTKKDIGNVDDQDKITIATQTGVEDPEQKFDAQKLTIDPHCYECKVKYRDPRPKDLVMFLHAWSYSGPDWKFVTELPNWAKDNWVDPPDYLD